MTLFDIGWITITLMLFVEGNIEYYQYSMFPSTNNIKVIVIQMVLCSETLSYPVSDIQTQTGH